MSGKEELTGLFSPGSESVPDSGQDDSIPDSWKSLRKSSSVDLKESSVHSSVGVNIYHPEFSGSLDSGKGRDGLAKDVFKHVNGDYDISAWKEYGPEDVIDLTVYLLDELDREGKLRGKDVVEYLEEFVEEEGNPDYLEGFRC